MKEVKRRVTDLESKGQLKQPKPTVQLPTVPHEKKEEKAPEGNSNGKGLEMKIIHV